MKMSGIFLLSLRKTSENFGGRSQVGTLTMHGAGKKTISTYAHGKKHSERALYEGVAQLPC